MNALLSAEPHAVFTQSRADFSGVFFLLSDVYEFVNKGGADLAYVDDLAWSIAHYRRTDSGREIIPQRPLKRFDLQGHEVSYSFNEESAKTAHRILNGSAISTTAVDRGFLRFALDVDYSPLSSLNFHFLEQIVSKFSENGNVVADFGRQFHHFSLDEKTGSRSFQSRYTIFLPACRS